MNIKKVIPSVFSQSVRDGVWIAGICYAAFPPVVVLLIYVFRFKLTVEKYIAEFNNIMHNEQYLEIKLQHLTTIIFSVIVLLSAIQVKTPKKVLGWITMFCSGMILIFGMLNLFEGKINSGFLFVWFWTFVFAYNVRFLFFSKGREAGEKIPS